MALVLRLMILEHVGRWDASQEAGKSNVLEPLGESSRPAKCAYIVRLPPAIAMALAFPFGLIRKNSFMQYVWR